MPDADPLAAALAAIRERAAKAQARQGDSAEWLGAALRSATEDMPRTLAALDAVLALADDWDVPATYLNDDMSDPNASARECANDLRAAITSALTGKDSSDEPG